MRRGLPGRRCHSGRVRECVWREQTWRECSHGLSHGGGRHSRGHHGEINRRPKGASSAWTRRPSHALSLCRPASGQKTRFRVFVPAAAPFILSDEEVGVSKPCRLPVSSCSPRNLRHTQLCHRAGQLLGSGNSQTWPDQTSVGARDWAPPRLRLM